MRLATWKKLFLSIGDRLTMINSVLDSLRNYFMLLFPISNKVVKQVDKIRRDFLIVTITNSI